MKKNVLIGLSSIFSMMLCSWADDLATVAALGNLTNAPTMYVDDVSATLADARSGEMTGVYFEGLDYAGSATRIFAYIGIPAGADADSPVPGVVLVHGGSGTAFDDWVQLWVNRGYAAISIAVEGQTAVRASQEQIDAGLATASGGNWLKHAMPGPERVGIYGDSSVEPITDQWMYHAVADAVLANSLLRSLPQVVAEDVGIMGASWGGVITSTAIGVDDRFKFAIPVYGCGNLDESLNVYGETLRVDDRYKEVWDPMVRIANITMPVLWLSWPTDWHFALDCQADCYNAAPGSHMVSLVPGMGHSHPSAWGRPESYDFADSVIAGTPWCLQQSATVMQGEAQVVFQSTRVLDEAWLVSTADSGHTGDRVWAESPATLVDNGGGRYTLTAVLPEDTTAWFINGLSGSLVASSDFKEMEVIASPASIMFVDASLANTTIDGAALVAGINYNDNINTNDSLWNYRNVGYLAYGNYNWESYNGEDSAPLVVSMTLPTAGTYRIYGFAVLASTDYNASFSTDGGDTYTDVTGTSDNVFYTGTYSVRDNYDVKNPDGVTDYQGKYMALITLGDITTTTDNQQFQVYVNDVASDGRTGFDGLGYEAVTGTNVTPNSASSVIITSTNPSDGMSTLSLDVSFDGTGGAVSSSGDFYVAGGLLDSNAFNQVLGLTFDAAELVNTTNGAEVTDGSFNRASDGIMGVLGGYGGGLDQHEGIGLAVDASGVTSSNFIVQVMSVQVQFVDASESLTIINRQDSSKKLTFGGSSSGAEVVITSALTDLDVSSLNLWVPGGESNEVAMIFGNEMPGGFGVYGVRVEGVPVGSVHAMFHDHMILQRDMAAPVWGKGHPGKTVSLLLDETLVGSTLVDSNGNWMVRLPPHATDGGTSHTLKVEVVGAEPILIQDVIFGDVYLASGQSNMEFEMQSVVGFAETEANANNPLIRHVKMQTAKSSSALYEPALAASWERTAPESIGHFSAVAYFFAKKMFEQTGVPVGLLNASYGGQRINRFINPEGMALVPELAGELTDQERGLIGSLYEIYNAMIGPLVPYGICGVLWYQGETDRYAPARYEQKMQALIRGYRAAWEEDDLPFYYFQLPNYNAADPYTLIRDAQLRALSEPDTGMAVLIDVGDDADIHPTNKQDPGNRLAQWALAKQFGQDIVYSGPIIHETLVEGSQIRVLFDYADGGLMIGQKVSTNPVVEVVGELQNFEIAGSDRVFTSAVAVIESDTVVVSAPAVSAPQYVRYCYHNVPTGINKLYNRAGLPAAAFRSDESVALEVVSGSGDIASVAPGSMIAIAADAPPAGQVFDRWIGAAGSVSDLNSAVTTITMPTHDVYLVATYRDSAASSYNVSVVNGSGDGTAQKGAWVSIEADPAPEGFVFDRWTGDTHVLANATAAATTLRMPVTSIAVTATFRAEMLAVNPSLTGLTVTGAAAQVSFQSVSDQRYTFDQTTNLVTGGWTPVIYNLKGDGRRKNLDISLQEGPQVFFRLCLK